MDLLAILHKTCISALKQAFPEAMDQIPLQSIEITEATSAEFGHFQFNGAMKLAKILKLKPIEIAHKLSEKIQNQTDMASVLESIEVKNPGFINFTIKASYLSQILNQNIRDERFGVPLHPKQKIAIDFSSPNIAKEMHVGHLRSTIIGDALRRLFEFLGHEVLPLNHVGDWGTQFGMLIAYLKHVLPNVSDMPKHIQLQDLARWYKEAKKKFDEDPIFKKEAQLAVVALQSHDPSSIHTWKMICEISREAYQHIYELLEVTLIERGESYYNEHLPSIVQSLEKKGLVTLSAGAKCVYLDNFTNREGEPLPLILQKSDGGYNYATTDLAALFHRIHDEQAKMVIYVVDAGQSLHFQMVFETAQKANFYDPKKVRVVHVPFGLVLRSDGKKFKTREGDTEKLIDLIHTAVRKSKEILMKRNEENHDKQLQADEIDHMAEVLGINAIKYADLACNRISDYVFSYDKMLKFEGNTAAFIMYALVRVLSIQRKVTISVSELLKQGTEIQLSEPSEIALGLLLCQFNRVLENMTQDLMPNRLTDYLYRVAEKFHLFFHHCRVEGSQEQNARLLLCACTAKVLTLGMQILGLKPLEKM